MAGNGDCLSLGSTHLDSSVSATFILLCSDHREGAALGFPISLRSGVFALLIILGSVGLAAGFSGLDIGEPAEEAPEAASSRVDDMPGATANTERLEFGEEMMLSRTGWYLVPVSVNAPADVRVTFETTIHRSTNGTAGFAHILASVDGTGDIVSLGSPGAVLAPQHALSANHGGSQVACCPKAPGENDTQDRGSASYQRTVRLEPDAIMYVGMAAEGWGPRSTHSATVEVARSTTAQRASLLNGTVETGTHARAFDLGREAYAQGTNVRHEGKTMVGEPGDARLTFQAKHSGLLLLRQDVSRDASGNLTIDLPNGTELDRGPREGPFGDPVPYRGTLGISTGPGETTVTWEDVDDPHDEELDQGSGTARAIGVFADLPISLRGVEERGPPVPNVSGSAGEAIVEFGADRLPAPTGWFVVPVTVNETAELSIEARSWMDPGTAGPRGSVVFYQAAGDRLSFRSVWVPASSEVAVSHGGQSISCCPGVDRSGSEPPASPGEMGGRGTGTTIEAGETLYLGFAAYEWGPSDQLLLRVASSSPSISVGEVAQGTNVRVVDLFQEAYREGTSLQAHGSPAVGEAGSASVTSKTAQGGFLATSWDLRGEGDAEIAVQAPGGIQLSPQAQDEVADLAGATGPGTFNATIRDAHRPGPDAGTLADGTQPDAVAMVLFADVEFPPGEIYGHRNPGGPEHR